MSTGTINLDEDIPNNFLVKYDRFSIDFWTVISGWIDLSISLTLVATCVLSGLTNYEGFTDDINRKLGLSNIITACTGTGLHILKSLANQTIQQRTDSLKQLIIQYNKNHPNYGTV